MTVSLHIYLAQNKRVRLVPPLSYKLTNGTNGWVLVILVFRYRLKSRPPSTDTAWSACGIRLSVHSEHLTRILC